MRAASHPAVLRRVGALVTALLAAACIELPTKTEPPVEVSSVSVTPPSANLSVGATTQLTATVLDAAGNPISAPTVAWISSDGALAQVSATGVVTAVAPGTATIMARSGGHEGSSTITVTTGENPPPPLPPPPGSVDFAEIVRGIRPRGFGATAYVLRTPASGRRVWYVSPSGNDAAAGDVNTPLKTINRAAQLAQAGDVVTIGAGTYNEAVSVRNSGTVDRPIVFQAAERSTVILSGGTNSFEGRTWAGEQQASGEFYVVVRGLIFRRYAGQTNSGAAAIRPSKGWVIEDCLLDEPGYIGIVIRQDDITITQTTIQRAYVDALDAWTPTDAALGPSDPAYDPLSGLRISDVILRENNITPTPLLGDVAEYVAKLWGTRGALIDNIESYDNYGPGFWFDTDNTDYVVRNSYFHDNRPVAGSDNEYGKGLFLEISWAPGLVERNVFKNNGGAGLALDNVDGVEVRDNLFAGNAHCVTFVNGDRGNSPNGQPRWPLRNINVHDNYCRDWTDSGAMSTIYGTFGTPASMGVVVDGNVYESVRNAALARWFNIGTFSTLADVRSRLGWESTGRLGMIAVP